MFDVTVLMRSSLFLSLLNISAWPMTGLPEKSCEPFSKTIPLPGRALVAYIVGLKLCKCWVVVKAETFVLGRIELPVSLLITATFNFRCLPD